MRSDYVVTLSGKTKYFDMLHYSAAILEANLQWCTLVPILMETYVNKNTIERVSKIDPMRRESILLKIHKQKINMSNALYVHFDKDDAFADYKESDTLKEIKFAMGLGLDIYFSNLPKDIGDDYKYYKELDYYIKASNYMILDGGNYCIDPINQICEALLNVITIDYLEPKLYERGKQHGLII